MNARFAMAIMPLRESLTMTTSDPYGNLYSITVGNTPTTNTITNIGGGTVGNVIYGGGGGYTTGGWLPIAGTATTIQGTYPLFNYPIVTPGEQLLNDTNVMDGLINRIVTQVDPDRELIVCIDQDCSPEVQKEIAQRLGERGIKGMVIPGARAGYGYPSFNAKPEDKRVDMLARIGELWEQRPDLKLTELFQWYAGADMEDEDFVKCTEVHFKKMSEM